MRPDERAREPGTLAGSQQKRLFQAIERSNDLLPASGECREVALRRPQIRASAQSAEGLQRQLEHAKKLRNRIAVAAAALAMIEEEVGWVAWAHYPSGSADEYSRIVDEASKSAGQAREAERTFSD